MSSQGANTPWAPSWPKRHEKNKTSDFDGKYILYNFKRVFSNNLMEEFVKNV